MQIMSMQIIANDGIIIITFVLLNTFETLITILRTYIHILPDIETAQLYLFIAFETLRR